VLPPRLPPPAPPPPRSGNSLLGCFFSVSLLVNIVAGLILFIGCLGMFFVNNSNSDETSIGGGLLEKLHSGKSGSKDKIAIISLEGLILEGMLDYVHKQIEQAAKDKSVKAVVLLINSPGGSITASDELHRKLVELRDGNKEKKYPAKPLVVSMSSLAASGGYYVAMPASTIYAEEATLTGSIGVYVSLPNVTGLAKQYGFTMNTIKAGKIKDSGSAFAVMSDEEHQVWQDMINTAYNRFAEVVVEGRKDKLKREDLTAEFEVDAIPGPPGDTPRLKRYKRYRADGGIWTAHKAKELKLVDEIGTVDDAVLAVHKLAAIGQDYKVIQYEQKPKTLRELLLGAETSHPGLALDPTRLKNLLAPRVWMLMPGYDLQAMVSSLEAK
jgi:protease-4